MKSKWLVMVMLFVAGGVARAQMPISDGVAGRAFDALQMLRDPAYAHSILFGEASGDHAKKFGAIVDDMAREMSQDGQHYKHGDFNLMVMVAAADSALTLTVLNLKSEPQMNRFVACDALLSVAIKDREFTAWKIPGTAACIDLPSTATPDAARIAVKKLADQAVAALKKQEEESKKPLSK